MKIYHKHVIFWILLENYIRENRWLSAGKFCEQERYFNHAYRWVSYKGATRISDTVYKELPDKVIERESFKGRSGVSYFKYRLVDGFQKHLPNDYKKISLMFKNTTDYQNYITRKLNELK